MWITAPWSGLGASPLSSPAASQSGSSSTLSDVIIAEQLLRAAPLGPGPGPGRVLIFRGLRVRMGMASGTGSSADVQYNQALGRAKYGGRLAAAAKAVQDCAQGGMVLCGPDTYSQLSMESLRASLVALSMGEHVVTKGSQKEGSEPEHRQIYQLLSPCLVSPVRRRIHSSSACCWGERAEHV
jgi:hypothetical protein